MQSENRRRRCFGRAPPADRGEGNRLPRRICARQSAGAPPGAGRVDGGCREERLDAPVRSRSGAAAPADTRPRAARRRRVWPDASPPGTRDSPAAEGGRVWRICSAWRSQNQSPGPSARGGSASSPGTLAGLSACARAPSCARRAGDSCGDSPRACRGVPPRGVRGRPAPPTAAATRLRRARRRARRTGSARRSARSVAWRSPRIPVRQVGLVLAQLGFRHG